MATLYRDKNFGTYYINYRVKGQRIRKALKTKSRTVARAMVRRIEADLLAGRLGEPVPILFSEATVEFIADRADVSKGQLDNYRYRFATFRDWLGSDPLLSDITPAILIDYRNFRAATLKAWTVNGDVRSLAALFRWAVEDRHYLDASPMTRNARRVTGLVKGERRALSPAERELYDKSLAGTSMYPAFLFGCYAGLRRGELIHLERSDIRGGVIYLTNKPDFNWTLKDYEARRVPLEPELVEVLSALPGEGFVLTTPTGLRWNPANFSRAWSDLVNDLKLPPERPSKNGKPARTGATLHELRHTYASLQILERDVDVYTLSRRLGHCDVKTSQNYFHLFKP